jgi:hypothetical protein
VASSDGAGIRADFQALDPRKVGLPAFPAMLTSPTLVNSDRASANAFQGLAGSGG